MKNILIICNYFAPENEVASIRISKFAKYLRRTGYKVSVLSERKSLNIKDEILLKDVEGIPVQYVENSRLLKKVDAVYAAATREYRGKNFSDVSSRMRYNRKAKKVIFYPFEKIHPILGTFDYLLKIVKQFDLFCSARKYLRNAKEDVDVCFSSYGGYFGHFAGSYMKKINPKIQWIADFRDPVYRFNFDPVLFTPAAIFYERWSCAKCDDIIVVTKGMARKLPAVFRKKIHCITNGYDLEDQKYFEQSDENKKFVISYTGRMYGGMQDVTAVFKAVRQLIDQQAVNPDDLEFRYAGTGFRIFESQAAEYGLESLCIDCGNVSRKESLAVQAGSAMLMIAVWDYRCQYIGAISGKALEYMMQRKPILAVINGDVPRNELAEMIRKAKLGAAYEESHADRDLPAMRDYIKLQYEQFTRYGKCKWEADEKIIAGYEYRCLTKKLIKVIEKESMRNERRDHKKNR